MAKSKIIWSNTAKKKLYAIFEADIRKTNRKEYSINLFKAISERTRLIVNDPIAGIPTSDKSVRAVIIETLIVCYGIHKDGISIFTISELSNNP